jgi:hypothetical protein
MTIEMLMKNAAFAAYGENLSGSNSVADTAEDLMKMFDIDKETAVELANAAYNDWMSMY